MESILSFNSHDEVDLLVVFNCLVCNKNLNFEDEESCKSIYHSYLEESKQPTFRFLCYLFGEAAFNKKKSDMICLECFYALEHIDFLEVQFEAEKKTFIQHFHDTLSSGSLSLQKNEMDCEDSSSAAFEFTVDKEQETMEEKDNIQQICIALEKSDDMKPSNLQKRMEDFVSASTTKTKVGPKRIIIRKSLRLPKSRTKELLPNSLKIEPSLGKSEAAMLLDVKVEKSTTESTLKTENLPTIDEDESEDHNYNSSKRLSCVACHKSFKNALPLRYHLLSCHSISECQVDSSIIKSLIQMNEASTSKTPFNFTCPWCQISLRDPQSYIEHSETHQKVAFKNYIEIISSNKLDQSNSNCLICNEKCDHASKLMQHTVHHVYGLNSCPLCNMTYSTRMQFIGHLEYFHKEYVMKCAECSHEFSDYLQFEHHMLIAHHYNLAKKCSKCNKCMLERDLKGRNVFSKAVCKECLPCPSSEYDWKCSECDYSSKYYGSYMSHRMGHLFGLHQCPLCKQKYLHSENLRRHLVESHPFINSLECRYCKKSLKHYDSLTKHLKIKHPESFEVQTSSSLLSCHLCSESFLNKDLLRYHMKSHKKAEKCEICGAVVLNLSIHMNLHKRGLQYLCRYCNGTFLSSSSLQSHLKRAHFRKESSKYKCQKCSKMFMYPGDLRRHISRVHEGQRSFKCTFCNIAFKNKGTLTYHMRKHTGEKPHQCGLCNASFEMPVLLKSHIIKTHDAQYKGVYFKGGTADRTDGEVSSISESPYLVHIDVPPTMICETVTEMKEPPSLPAPSSADAYLGLKEFD